MDAELENEKRERAVERAHFQRRIASLQGQIDRHVNCPSCAMHMQAWAYATKALNETRARLNHELDLATGWALAWKAAASEWRRAARATCHGKHGLKSQGVP